MHPFAAERWFSWVGNQLPGGEGRFTHPPVGGSSKYLAKLLWKSLGGAGMLNGVLGKEMRLLPSSIFGLRDTPVTGPQALHTDWQRSKAVKYANDSAHMPLSILWACSKPFLLRIGKYGPHAAKVETVNPGEMIVFRGDLRHGGGGHVTHAFRVHGYIARKGDKRPVHIYYTSPRARYAAG